ncbi:Coenzyme A biosynthesis bifunctional protein CoaBC [Austwickia sp. TVS 96-490-7B]|uniref:bifunctional phosphopantothenoylcysteine decarboxylase/phosphopantothenate--cysteine ligase CoaBC n=1 Tax=Austwickia sp. TVS 96-490-7B TaxID=2830843 RepID=UPI001C57886F|nr:bifunctional phosphopantothenoylcysteine decarboxylase/phosphopantothenate--cysteine ligase CoaBC [Austwickia sp. TVS 96-490-7B]MBW3086039.1 Coenzyme A biosynthesis bifunctional protein CoaBC [Austwickia sp. TVS 96-490-7B]
MTAVVDPSHHRRTRVVLGVGGGIAAYKACALSRLFSEGGLDVQVVPTEAALHFVGAATWEALSGHPVSATVWEGVDEVRHVRIGQSADLVVIAPATADLLARAAHGMADDLLTTVLLTARCPVLMAPAMHTEMWQHPATQANVDLLRSRGIQVLDPAVGRLTGRDTGPGRLPDPEVIHDAAMALLRPAPVQDLSGRHVVITAGGTREPLDPVRFLGNRSSGKQGYAVAEDAARRGATVDLISANVTIPEPFSQGASADRECAGRIRVRSVETAEQMAAAVAEVFPQADVVVMAAAVADFRPARYAPSKIKKEYGEGADSAAPVIELVRNPDILAGLVARRGGAQGFPVLVGFAAETGDEQGSVLELARRKLARKGCDLLVVNEVGENLVFGQDHTTVTVLAADRDAPLIEVTGTKAEAATAVLDAVVLSLAQFSG